MAAEIGAALDRLGLPDGEEMLQRTSVPWAAITFNGAQYAQGNFVVTAGRAGIEGTALS